MAKIQITEKEKQENGTYDVTVEFSFNQEELEKVLKDPQKFIDGVASRIGDGAWIDEATLIRMLDDGRFEVYLKDIARKENKELL